MRASLKASLTALAGAVVLVAATVSGSSAASGPSMVAGTGSCTTDASGVCTIRHTLGSTPDSVVATPATPGGFNGYMLNVVGGSLTASSFKVRAMFTATQPKANGTIWVNWVASIGQPAPPPPPTSPPSSTPATTTPPTSASPPPSSTTSVPPTTTTTTTAACLKPTVFSEQDGGDFPVPAGEGDSTTASNSYFVFNNAWNWQGTGSGQTEKLTACSASSWYADDYGFAPSNGEVFMYPDAHLDINSMNGKPLSTWKTITGRFAGKGPGAGSYDAAWDLWLNGVADKNSFELMVWTEKHGQADPAGSLRGTYTDPLSGQVYDVWWDGTHTNQAYLAYVAQQTQYSGTIDLHAMIVNAQKQGYLPAGDTTVNQIDYGDEVRDTAGATSAHPYRFTVTDFGITLK